MIHDFFTGLTSFMQFATRDFWTVVACVLILRAFWSWRLVTVSADRKVTKKAVKKTDAKPDENSKS